MCKLVYIQDLDYIFYAVIHMMSYFSKTLPNHLLHILQQHGFIVRVCLPHWPACSQDLSPTENHLAHKKVKQI